MVVIEADIFEPKTFNEATPSSGPQFICMYIGERSNKLDIQEQHGINKNDGWKINTICDNGNLGINNSSGIPDDFQSGNSSIPYFLVKYGDQNQSLFKNIKVDQMEFTETDEGLQIIEDLGNRNRNNSIGQNLFDIYTNRSYSAEVEMLGCAQIQPFMYFQLDNVPMFTGAYTIINTRHSIKPNHMTTTFKGVRIRYGKTKMIDDETLYYHLIGNLADVSNEGVLYDDSKTKIKDLKPKSYPPTHPIYAPVLSEFTPTELTTDIAQTYMERVAIEGVELPLTAIQLKEIADKYNYPFELMILQAAQESNFGTNGAATSTHNIFNVGNTTPGDTLTPEEAMARGYRVDYGKWEKGVRIYIQLMQRAYIPKSGSWTVLLDFNKFRRYDWAPEGHRYALDMDYEGSLRKHKEALNELI